MSHNAIQKTEEKTEEKSVLTDRENFEQFLSSPKTPTYETRRIDGEQKQNEQQNVQSCQSWDEKKGNTWKCKSMNTEDDQLVMNETTAAVEETLDGLLGNELMQSFYLRHHCPVKSMNRMYSPSQIQMQLEKLCLRSLGHRRNSSNDSNTSSESLKSNPKSISFNSPPLSPMQNNCQGNENLLLDPMFAGKEQQMHANYCDMLFYLRTLDYNLQMEVLETQFYSRKQRFSVQMAAQSIYRTFVAPRSRLLIQLPQHVCDAIASNVNDPTRDIFVDASLIVYERLKTGFLAYKFESTGPYSYTEGIRNAQELRAASICRKLFFTWSMNLKKHGLSQKEQQFYYQLLVQSATIPLMKHFFIQHDKNSSGISLMLPKKYLFFLECCAFSVCPSKSYRLMWGRKIYDKFMLEERGLQVPPDMCSALRVILINTAPTNTFSAVQEWLFSTICQYFSVLQRSPFFLQILERLRDPLTDYVHTALKKNSAYEYESMSCIEDLSETSESLLLAGVEHAFPSFEDMVSLEHLPTFYSFADGNSFHMSLLLAWLDIKEYQQIPPNQSSTDFAFKAGIRIWNRYFRPGASDPLPIPIDIRRQIVYSLPTASPVIFNSAQRELEYILRDNVYIAFLQSAQCRELREKRIKQTCLQLHNTDTQFISDLTASLVMQSMQAVIKDKHMVMEQSFSSNNNAQICDLPHISLTACFGARTPSIKFEDLLQQPENLELFTEYLEKNHALESLLCYQEMRVFRSIPNDAFMLRSARKIYAKFLKSNAKQKITYIPESCISAIADQLEHNIATPGMFDIAQICVEEFLAFQKYADFCRSYTINSSPITSKSESLSFLSNMILEMSNLSPIRSLSDSHDVKSTIGEAVDLHFVINNPVCNKAFRAFLTRTLSIENLLFNDEVDNFKAACVSNSLMRRLAKKIVTLFVLDHSKQQVNLPGHLQQRIIANYHHPSPMLFDDAQRSICTLMQEHCLPAFITSPEGDVLGIHLKRSRRVANMKHADNNISDPVFSSMHVRSSSYIPKQSARSATTLQLLRS